MDIPIRHIIIFFITAYTLYPITIISSNIIEGSIQFPSFIQKVPMVRIYCAGRKIPYQYCDIDSINNHFKYQIPKSQYQRTFTLLITEPQNLEFVPITGDVISLSYHNTIDHIRLNKEALIHNAYHYYSLKIQDDLPTNNADEYAALMRISQGTQKLEQKWYVSEQKLTTHNGIIPDETIIICYPAHCIAHVSGDVITQLPTIYLKQDMLKLVGSEIQLKEFSDKIVLASLDLDALHAPLRQENNIKREPKCNIIAAPTA
jgi:hypothetical protein